MRNTNEFISKDNWHIFDSYGLWDFSSHKFTYFLSCQRHNSKNYVRHDQILLPGILLELILIHSTSTSVTELEP